MHYNLVSGLKLLTFRMFNYTGGVDARSMGVISGNTPVSYGGKRILIVQG